MLENREIEPDGSGVREHSAGCVLSGGDDVLQWREGDTEPERRAAAGVVAEEGTGALVSNSVLI